jgi:hypothetical protein
VQHPTRALAVHPATPAAHETPSRRKAIGPARARRRPRWWRATVRAVRQEPVQAQGLFQTGLVLFVSMGIPMSTELRASILAFSASLLAFIAHRKVTPVSRPRDQHGRRLTSSP